MTQLKELIRDPQKIGMDFETLIDIKVRDYVSSLTAFFRSVEATPLFTLESLELTRDVQISEEGGLICCK